MAFIFCASSGKSCDLVSTRSDDTQMFSWLLHKLHNIHQNIQFTMETKRDEHWPSLHTDIYRRPDGSMGNKVYQEPTT